MFINLMFWGLQEEFAVSWTDRSEEVYAVGHGQGRPVRGQSAEFAEHFGSSEGCLRLGV